MTTEFKVIPVEKTNQSVINELKSIGINVKKITVENNKIILLETLENLTSPQITAVKASYTELSGVTPTSK